MRSLVIGILLALALASSAFAAPNSGPVKPPAKDDDVPAGTIGSGGIPVDMMVNDLQFLLAKKSGIVVNYILPKTWTVVEQTKDVKGKPTPGIFVLLSHRPMPGDEPTDFIWELDIYDKNLFADIPTGLSKEDEEKERGKRLWDFLNSQISFNAKGGLKLQGSRKDIGPKEYGPTSRPKTMFVPMYYEVPAAPNSKSKGSMLYTFTSVTGGKVWQLKFLVAKDQIDNYGALIALTLENTFGLTDAQFAELEKNTTKFNERANEAIKQNQGKPKPK
jgi:hypothetical protein